MHDTDLLPHPGATSWGGDLMLDISANSMLCFARSFHFLLPRRGTVHDFSSLSCSRTPFVLVTRVRLPGDGGEGRRQEENAILGPNSHEPDEGRVSSCVWFCSTSKSRILMKEKKKKSAIYYLSYQTALGDTPRLLSSCLQLLPT